MMNTFFKDKGLSWDLLFAQKTRKVGSYAQILEA